MCSHQTQRSRHSNNALSIFHIPEGTAQTLAELQLTIQRTLRVEQIPHRWIIEHKLFRSTPNPAAPQDPIRYHHLLNLSHIPGKTFLHITDPEGTVIAIPASQSDGFAQLLMFKLSALWTPRYSHLVHGGTGWSNGEFNIRLGEVRTSGPQGQSRGVVVCISEQVFEDDNEEDGIDSLDQTNGAGAETNGEMGQEELEAQLRIIREVWEKCNVQGAKETAVKVLGQTKEQRAFAEVRMWGELLKFRG